MRQDCDRKRLFQFEKFINVFSKANTAFCFIKFAPIARVTWEAEGQTFREIRVVLSDFFSSYFHFSLLFFKHSSV